MIKILILDDDNEWSNLTAKEYLQGENLEVKCEEFVRNALQEIKNEIYDVLIIDFQLINQDEEYEDGIQVICKIREFDKFIPIILISGRINDTEEGSDIYKDALNLGVCDFFDKGLSIDHLMNSIDKAVNFHTDDSYKTFMKMYKDYADKDKIIIVNTNGDKFSIKDIATEIRKGSDFGLKIKEGLSDFSLQILNKS